MKNDKLTEIKTEIGTVRVSKRFNAITAGCWAIAGTFGARILVANPSIISGLLVVGCATSAILEIIEYFINSKILSKLNEELIELKIAKQLLEQSKSTTNLTEKSIETKVLKN